MANKVKDADLIRCPIRSTETSVLSPRKSLLLKVGSKLKPPDIEELQFFVRDCISDETALEIPTAFSLLECLDQYGYLDAKYTTLRTYLESSRNDLVDLIAEAVPECNNPSSPLYTRCSAHLQVTTPVWPYNTFRKCAVEVFRELDEDEVKQIRYLSQDFIAENIKTPWEKEMTGVELLIKMEDSGLVGPGNYSFLIDRLDDIGRLDLIQRLPPSGVPYIPESFNTPALLHQNHLDQIQHKQTQYQFGMSKLLRMGQMPPQITAQHASGYYRRILEVLSPRPLTNHAKMLEKLSDTLINMSLYLNDLISTMQEFERNGNSALFHQYLSNCKHHLAMLQRLMEEMEWACAPRKRERSSTSRQYHPVRQVSYCASTAVLEFLLEFSLNRETFQQESRELSFVLESLESLLYVCGFMWSLTSWLVGLMQVAICSPVSLEKYESLLRLLVNRNKHMIESNSRLIMNALISSEAGKRLVECSKFKVVDKTFHRFQAAVIPMALFTFLLQLFSNNSSLSSNDTEEILASLRQSIGENEQAFCNIYQEMTAIVMNGICGNIEAFRCAKLQEFASHNVHSVEKLFVF